MLTSDEISSINALVDESGETAEIAQQLSDYLRHDQRSVEHLRALFLEADSEDLKHGTG